MSQEALTPRQEQQQADFGAAVILAHSANHQLVGSQNHSRMLAETMETRELYHAASIIATIKEHHANYQDFRFAAELIMPPRSAFESTETVREVDESLATPEVWGAMSREQRAFTLEARTAMATGKLKEYGVTEGSLRVLMTEADDGKSKFTLVHTGNGVDIGNPKKDYDRARSYNGVMSSKNDKLFQIKVGGVLYDARKGMKDKIYDAKVEDARAREVTLPDSQELAAETRDVWTWTMLTGDSLTADGGVPIRGVCGGGSRDVGAPDSDGRDVRVCPAVEIPDFTS